MITSEIRLHASQGEDELWLRFSELIKAKSPPTGGGVVILSTNIPDRTVFNDLSAGYGSAIAT